MDDPGETSKNPYVSARWLAQRFCDELELVGRLTSGSIQNNTPTWLKGTELVLVAHRNDLQRLLEAWQKRYGATSKIQDLYSRDGVLHVSMAWDPFQWSRTDRNVGNPANSMANNEPVDSRNVEQKLQIIGEKSGLDLHAPAVTTIFEEFLCFGKQVLIHWFRVSCRMSAKDTTTIVDCLGSADYQSLKNSKYVNRLIQRLGNLPCNTARVLEFAVMALVEAMPQFLSINWLELYRNPKLLAESFTLHSLGLGDHATENKYGAHLVHGQTQLDHVPKLLEDASITRCLSIADHATEDKYGVLFVFKGQTQLYKRRGPSFIISRSDKVSFKDQIHVIGRDVCEKHGAMLALFDREPDTKEIDVVENQLRRELCIPETTACTVTLPFKKISGDPWFRADGWIDRSFFQLLNQELRNVLGSRDTQEHVCGNTESIQSHWIFQPGRRKARIWPFSRQSNDDGHRDHDTIPDQIETLLQSGYDMGMIREGDHILGSVETCSSSKHPRTDRPIFRSIPTDLPLILLTTNPDRSTRRAEEVHWILNFLEASGGAWFTQAFTNRHGKSAIKEDPRAWTQVTPENAGELQKRLRIGRQRAIQSGFVTTSSNAVIRIADSLDRGSAPRQLQAIHHVVRLAMEQHRFTKILLVSQACTQSGDGVKASRSVAAQTKFLRHMVPNDMTFELQEESTVSTSSGALIDIIKTRVTELSEDGSKILILSTRLDRVVRHQTPYEELCDFLLGAGHGAASFFWDHETNIDVCYALRLDPAFLNDSRVVDMEDMLKIGRRAPDAAINVPVAQLLIWIAPDGAPKAHPAIATAERHLVYAQQWAEAGVMSNYQGTPNCATKLKVKNIHRFTESETKSWTERFSSGLDAQGSEIILKNKPELIFRNAIGSSYRCSCAKQVSEGATHDYNCQCRCAWCDHARSCPCTQFIHDRSDRGLCQCPYLCNCTCKDCHKWDQGQAGATKAQGKRTRVGHALCDEDGCQALIYRSGLCSTHWRSWKDNQPCTVCGQKVEQKYIYGQAHHACRLQDPEYSQEKCEWNREPCSNLRYKGGDFGRLCPEHGRERESENSKKRAAKKAGQAEIRDAAASLDV